MSRDVGRPLGRKARTISASAGGVFFSVPVLFAFGFPLGDFELLVTTDTGLSVSHTIEITDYESNMDPVSLELR